MKKDTKHELDETERSVLWLFRVSSYFSSNASFLVIRQCSRTNHDKCIAGLTMLEYGFHIRIRPLLYVEDVTCD